MLRLTVVALAFVSALIVTDAADAGRGAFLHNSEAVHQTRLDVYGKADQVGAFHVALGECVRQSRSAIHCSASLWRKDRYGWQLRCNYIDRVTKARRKGRNVRGSLRGYCGAADPPLPEPQPAPAPPEPGEPAYPDAEDGSPHQPPVRSTRPYRKN